MYVCVCVVIERLELISFALQRIVEVSTGITNEILLEYAMYANGADERANTQRRHEIAIIVASQVRSRSALAKYMTHVNCFQLLFAAAAIKLAKQKEVTYNW